MGPSLQRVLKCGYVRHVDTRKEGKFMTPKEKKLPLNPRIGMTFVIGSMLLCCSLSSFGQKPVRGTIEGRVTADQGQVTGFRVAAHNLDRKLWYTVFTVKSHYTIPQALPGRYEVMVFEPEYDSPKSPVQLGPGESKTIDISIRKNAAIKPNAAKIEYVSTMDEVFPPGPGLDLMKENCTGCHGSKRPVCDVWTKCE